MKSENTNDDILALNLEYEWTNIEFYFLEINFYFQQCVISKNTPNYFLLLSFLFNQNILLRGVHAARLPKFTQKILQKLFFLIVGMEKQILVLFFTRS